MIWNPFRVNRLLKTAIKMTEEANENTRRALDNARAFQKLCDEQSARLERQASRIGELLAETTAQPRPMYELMGLPTVEAVEGMVNGYFASAPVSLCQQAIEGAGPIIELKPDEVRVTQRVLRKLWYHAAMKRMRTGPQ